MTGKNQKQKNDPALAELGNRLPDEDNPLRGQSSGEFIISHTCEAPRDVVFKAWTEADKLSRWWGPSGFTVFSCKVALRPGGLFHYGLRAPNGMEVWGRFVYREILVPEKLVYVMSFSDPNGGITRHPLSPNWPAETLNTVLFQEQNGKTLVTIKAVTLNAGEIERKTFIDGLSSLQNGFAGTLEQLDDYLGETRGNHA
jgi:uncharacterized protein YndB with AHSA1/START domain